MVRFKDKFPLVKKQNAYGYQGEQFIIDLTKPPFNKIPKAIEDLVNPKEIQKTLPGMKFKNFVLRDEGGPKYSLEITPSKKSTWMDKSWNRLKIEFSWDVNKNKNQAKATYKNMMAMDKIIPKIKNVASIEFMKVMTEFKNSIDPNWHEKDVQGPPKGYGNYPSRPYDTIRGPGRKFRNVQGMIPQVADYYKDLEDKKYET